MNSSQGIDREVRPRAAFTFVLALVVPVLVFAAAAQYSAYTENLVLVLLIALSPLLGAGAFLVVMRKERALSRSRRQALLWGSAIGCALGLWILLSALAAKPTSPSSSFERGPTSTFESK